jgi:hypothetical protein
MGKVVQLCPDDEFEKKCEQWVAERDEWDVFKEISGEFIERLTVALKSEDQWEPIRIIARTERLMGFFMSIGHDRWLPSLHRQLRDTLHIAHRKARRVFIKRALTGKGRPLPPDVNIRTLDGPEAEEDRAAVERHLREGTRLLEGLTRGKAAG